MEEKMWAIFKIIFLEEYYDLVEETKVTTGESFFHSSNVMHKIGGALEHLAMASGDDKDIFSKLNEAVDQLTNTNESLTAQLSESMKIKNEMDKKLNLKAAQGQDPKG